MEKHRCDKPTGNNVAAAFVYPELGKVDPKSLSQGAAQSISRPHDEEGKMADFSRVIVNRLWNAFFGRGLVSSRG